MPPAADAPTWEEMEKTNAAMETARDALAALSISDRKTSRDEGGDDDAERTPPVLMDVLYSIFELVESSPDHLCGVDEQFQDILRDNEMKEAVKVLLGHNAKKLPGLSYEAPRDAVNMLGGAPSEELTVPSVDSPESVPNFKAPADLTEIEIVVKYRIKKEQMLHRIYIKRLATWAKVWQSLQKGHKCYGSFYKNKIHGKATYMTKTYKYTGEYYKNNKQGRGTLKDGRGEYNGFFVNGDFERGSYRRNDGTIIEGEFENFICVKEEVRMW